MIIQEIAHETSQPGADPSAVEGLHMRTLKFCYLHK